MDTRDTLDTAVAGPSLVGGIEEDAFNMHVADREQYDSNIYRLPNGTDAASVVGPSASRQDHLNSPSAGVDAQWVSGRQIFNVALDADYNRYANDTDLNYLSSHDKIAWNWGLGGVVSGQVGAEYLRDLASFVNATLYTRNVYQRSDYFATARYQVGPRWSLYGGLLNTVFSLADSESKGNDSRQKSVDMGAEFATNVDDTFGLDYRYTDARYPNAIELGNSSFDPDYREDRIRFLIKRALSEKTSVDISVGYLKREYAEDSVIGSFSAPIWRGVLGWQPTEKTQVILSGWRNLQAYLTDQTNYYQATGVSISPVWVASEKITLTLLVSREQQNYIGSSPVEVNQSARRDTVNAELASVSYVPIHALTLDFSFRHEQRDSNQQLRTYTDELASAGIKFEF